MVAVHLPHASALTCHCSQAILQQPAAPRQAAALLLQDLQLQHTQAQLGRSYAAKAAARAKPAAAPPAPAVAPATPGRPKPDKADDQARVAVRCRLAVAQACVSLRSSDVAHCACAGQGERAGQLHAPAQRDAVQQADPGGTDEPWRDRGALQVLLICWQESDAGHCLLLLEVLPVCKYVTLCGRCDCRSRSKMHCVQSAAAVLCCTRRCAARSSCVIDLAEASCQRSHGARGSRALAGRTGCGASEATCWTYCSAASPPQ